MFGKMDDERLLSRSHRRKEALWSHRVLIFTLSRTDRILWILIDAGNHEAYAPTPTFETCNL